MARHYLVRDLRMKSFAKADSGNFINYVLKVRVLVVAALRIIASVLLILGPTFYFGLKGDAAKMGIAAAAGAAAAAFLNFDKLEAIKLLGFEAKLRKAIQEAYATLESVQALAVEAIAANVLLISRSGRFGGNLGIEGSIAAMEKFRLVSEKLQVNNNPDILGAFDEHYDYMAFDYFNRFQKECKGYAHDLADELAGLCKIEPKRFPNEDEILAVFEKHVFKLQPDDRDRLEDYLYYRQHHRPRRTDIDI